MIAQAAVISKIYLNDENRAKMYADMAADINPGQEVLRAAYACADIEYEPDQYTDTFKDVRENFDRGTIAVATDTQVKISPNPFNPVTTIQYTLPETASVTLTVYSITGQKVTTLVNETMDAGAHSVQFNGTGLSSGIYLYRFESPGFADTGKMLLVK